MEEISLHILDIAENSIAAGARTLTIVVEEDETADLLRLEIDDDGRGMNADAATQAVDPFYTTRTTRRVGMGLALLHDATVRAGGAMELHSTPGRGTTVRATFRLSHVDRQPLGNMADTIIALIANRAGVDVIYRHARNGRSIEVNTQEIRNRLGGMPVSSPEALGFLRAYLMQEEESLVDS